MMDFISYWTDYVVYYNLIGPYIDFIVFCIGNSAIIIAAFYLGRMYDGS